MFYICSMKQQLLLFDNPPTQLRSLKKKRKVNLKPLIASACHVWNWWITTMSTLSSFILLPQLECDASIRHYTFRQRQLCGGKTRPWPWCVKYRFHMECTGWINEAGPVQLQQVAEGLTGLYFSGLDAEEEWCAFSLSAATVHSCVMLSLIHEA